MNRVITTLTTTDPRSGSPSMSAPASSHVLQPSTPPSISTLTTKPNGIDRRLGDGHGVGSDDMWFAGTCATKRVIPGRLGETM